MPAFQSSPHSRHRRIAKLAALALVCALGPLVTPSRAEAQETTLGAFVNVVDDSATAVIVGIQECGASKSDAGFWLQTLTVSQSMDNALEAAVDAGRAIRIRVHIDSTGATLGNGTGYHSTWVQASCGSNACGSAQETRRAPVDYAMSTDYNLLVQGGTAKALTAGQQITLRGFGLAVVNPNGCKSIDQAGISTDVNPAALIAE